MVVKRSHTSANVAPSIRKLLEQTNAKYPKRSKDSDGIWPSAAHTKANPNSDHEAGNALDITADLGTKTTMRGFIAWVLVNPHPALEYIIHDGTIWSRSRDFKPVRYAGSNPHRSHAHFSVRESKRSSTRAWVLPADYPLRVLKVGELYALAAMFGAVIVVAGDALGLPSALVGIAGALATFALRMFSVRFGLTAPRARGSD